MFIVESSPLSSHAVATRKPQYLIRNWNELRTADMENASNRDKKKGVDYQQQDEGRFHTERSRCHGLDKGRWWWWKPSRARDVSSSGSEKKNRFLFCRYAGSNQKGLREFRKRGEEEQKKGNMGKCSVVLLVKFMILAPTRRGHQQKPWDGHMNPCNCPERARGGRTKTASWVKRSGENLTSHITSGSNLHRRLQVGKDAIRATVI